VIWFQDSLAKQTVDIVLNQIINAKGVFVTAECANNFKCVACGPHSQLCARAGRNVCYA